MKCSLKICKLTSMHKLIFSVPNNSISVASHTTCTTLSTKSMHGLTIWPLHTLILYLYLPSELPTKAQLSTSTVDSTLVNGSVHQLVSTPPNTWLKLNQA